MPKGSHKLLTHSQTKQRVKYYRRGLNDSEMARKLNITREAVRQWRSKNRLRSLNPRTTNDHLIKRMKRYGKGWTDREIAEREGVSVVAIIQWRDRNNLNPN